MFSLKISRVLFPFACLYEIIGCQFLVLLWCLSARGQDKELEARFFRDAPVAWAKFQQSTKRVHGTYSLKEVLASGEVSYHQKREVKQGPGCVLMLEQAIGDKETPGVIRSWNPKYAFELRRSGEEKDWALSKLDMGPGGIHPLDSLAQEVTLWSEAPITFISLSNFAPNEKKGSWPEMIKSKDFSLKKITTQEIGSKKLVRVDFDYKPNAVSKRVPSEISGWVRFDPEMHWFIREYDIELRRPPPGDTVTHAGSYEYGDSSTPSALLQRLEFRYANPNNSYKSTFSYEFNFHQADSPQSDFTLSAFGLPEPVGVTCPGAARGWLWISLVAVASLVLGVLFARLKHRSPPPAPAGQ